MGNVDVEVLSAHGLPPKDLNGKADPYVVLTCGGARSKQKSTVQEKTLEPSWDDAKFEFRNIAGSSELIVQMFDKDTFSKDDPMGQVRVRPRAMDGRLHDFTLQPMEGCGNPRGKIRMRCTATIHGHNVQMAVRARPSTHLRVGINTPIGFTRCI